jgi:hypothetical protein
MPSCTSLASNTAASGERYKQRPFDHEQVRLFIVVMNEAAVPNNLRPFAIYREPFDCFASCRPGHIARSAQLRYCAETYE